MKRELSDTTHSFQDITLDAEAINTIRLLAVDMVEKARSGHPGLPLGAAPMACVLFTKIMNHNPANPQWINRDRFVLSAGHGSALLYALLHLTGYDLSLDELKSFRQWGSKTPGHPEYGLTPGVETTTGPLGQGIATAVGMAIAENHCAAMLNRDGLNPIDYFTYVICSDGDLMEGISSEASSLAGHLKLGKLICLYDSNRISIEGSTTLTFTENIEQRYLAYGWHVDHVDGNDAVAIEKAVLRAKTVTGQPSMIIAKTIIGYGSPGKQNSSAAHGEPLGNEETRLVKKAFGFPENAVFHISEKVRALFLMVKARGQMVESGWNALWDQYRSKFPDRAQFVEDRLHYRTVQNHVGLVPSFDSTASIATRQASKETLSLFKTSIPFLVGGSADLGPSCGTIIKTETDFAPDNCSGTNLHFGVREHAMGAIINGMALSRIIIPYGATFLVFADYMKPALRLAALMKLHAIFLFSHDSIALGEDGPTHQPVEQLAMLRAIPGMTVIRPADAYETAGAWQEALQRKTPTVLVLSRQALPVLDPEHYPVREGARKGGYILCDWQDQSTGNNEKAIIIASGAEVHIAVEARKMLESERIFTRVVSMPSIELFDEQPESYRTAVLPPQVKNRVVVEAASPFGWHKYAGEKGRIVGIDHFGASAPGNTVLREFGFTAEHLVSEIKVLFRKKEPGK